MKKQKHMKLPNGYGSVHKLKGNRRNPYVVKKTIGFDKDNKQIIKIIGYYPTYEDGLQALAIYNNAPYNIDLKNITFKELYNMWLDKKEKKVESEDMAENTLKLYKNAFKNHCEPLHDKAFIKIKTKDIQDIVDDCDGGFTLKRYIKSLCSTLYDYASELDVPITKNYAEYVELTGNVKSTLHTFIPEDKLDILWSNLYVVEDVDLALIIAYTGLRANELLGILKDNVHLEERYMIGGNKTDAGKDRIIPIHERIVPLIENRLKTAKKYLITSNWGMGMSYQAFRERWDRMMLKLGLDYLPHDGRHTCSTRLDNVNANPLCVKLILGHKVKDVTYGVYTHKTTQQLIETINLLA